MTNRPWRQQQVTAGSSVQLSVQWWDQRPVSRRRGYQKHSWVRKKQNCFSPLPRRSFASRWADLTMQWLKFQLLWARSQHWEEGGTQKHFCLGCLDKCPPPPLLLRPPSTARVMLTNIYAAPRQIWPEDRPSWKQHSSSLRLGALAKLDPLQHWHRSSSHAQDISDTEMCCRNSIHPAHPQTSLRHAPVCIYCLFKLVSIFPSLLPHVFSPFAISAALSYLMPWNFKVVCWLRLFEIAEGCSHTALALFLFSKSGQRVQGGPCCSSLGNIT